MTSLCELEGITAEAIVNLLIIEAGMSMDGKWGDWIALWGLTDMLNILVALVSSLGEAGLKMMFYSLSLRPAE